ncbi:hypothetical protein, partial [Variovorax ginsengisoli]
MQFSELPVGAKFRFFRRGLLLTKASKSTYAALAGHAQKAALDAEVLPEDEMLAPTAPTAPTPDDVALITKVFDAF